MDVRAATHDYWDRGLIGLAVDPAIPRAALRLRLLRLGPRQRAGTTAARRRPGRRTRVAWSTAGSSRVNVNTGQRRPCWSRTTASSSRATASAGSRSGPTARCTRAAGDGASFNYADERPTAQPAGQPVRRPARARAARSAARTCARAATRSASTARSCGSTRHVPLAARRERDAADRRPRACATRSGSPSAPAPARSGSADVGWNTWEEINRCTPGAASRNFGWPCYEGAGAHGRLGRAQQPGLRGALRREPARHTAPYYAYDHGAKVVAERDAARPGTSSISGLAFYDGGTFPAEYDGALFFADYARKCVWAMLRRDATALPDPDAAAHVHHQRAGRSTCRSGRAATCSTSTSTARRPARAAANGNRPTRPGDRGARARPAAAAP